MSDELDRAPSGPTDMGTAALEAIEAEALALEGQADKQAQQQQAQVTVDEASAMVPDLLDVLKMARGMIAPAYAWWPAFLAVWNDDVLHGMATHGATLMVRHGWTMGRLLSEWGPYIGLLACMAPAAMATVQAHKARKAQQKEAANVGHKQATN